MNNIVSYLDMLQTLKNKEIKTGFDLYEEVKDNEKLLKWLCEAVMQTNSEIEHIKKILG